MIQFFATRVGHRELALTRDFDCGTYGCERDTIGAVGYVFVLGGYAVGPDGYTVCVGCGAVICGLTSTAGCDTTGGVAGDVVSRTERVMRAPDCTTGSGGIAVGTCDTGAGDGGSMLVHAAIVS
jgi:hypothetical protein